MRYLYPNQIVYLHQRIIQETGGTQGLRDRKLLESAVFRPQATFGGTDLYADIYTKAAVLGYSIIQNHPFLDGNKRVGFEAMRLMLRLNGLDVRADLNVKYDFVIEIAKGNLNEQQIIAWLKTHTKPYPH